MKALRNIWLSLLATSCAMFNFLALADYSSTVLSLNPVGYYRLGETTAVPANIATNSGTAGAIGNGFYVKDDAASPMHPNLGALVGSTDGGATFSPGLMEVPFDSSINPQGAFTAELWVQPSTAPAALTCPIAYGKLENPGEAPNRSGWLLYQDNGSSSGGSGWNFRMYNHDGINRSVTLTGGAVPEVGTWYHVAVSYDGTTAFLYVNGVQVASGLAPGYAGNLGGNFSVGCRNDLAFAFAGLVDEVAVYTNALSSADLLTHYQNGTNSAPSTPYDVVVKANNPLLYYRFNEPAFIPSATPPTTQNLGSWGAALNGSLEDNLTMGQPGPRYSGFESTNRAPYFNGLEGTVVITNPPLNTDTCSFTAWVKRHGPLDSRQGIANGGYAAILFQRGTSTATGFGFGLSNELRYHYEDKEYDWAPSPALTVPDEVWSFVAVVYTPTQTVLYLNGVAATNVVAHGAHDFSVDNLYIGQDPTGNRIVDGFIDEVAIFDKALSSAQLRTLFAAGAMPPIITAQPKGPGGTIYEGFNISFSVAAVGGTPLSYQWRKNSSNLSGQTQTTFSKNNVLAADSGNYDVVVTNPNGSVTSSVVSITILAGPPILSQVPASISRFPGGTAIFSATAVGSSPITYQWYKGANPIAGATGSTLTIKQLQAPDADDYSVLVTNPNGNTNSPIATLTILPVAPNSVGAILSQGPIAFWRLNETNGATVFDSVGGFDGTFSPVTTLSGVGGPQPSAFKGLEADNTAFSFNGNTSDINCRPFNATLAAATIVAFIQPRGLPPTDLNGLVYSRGGGGQVAGLNLRTTTGSLAYNWNDTAADYNWESNLTPLTNVWNFVALVIDPTQATMYLDSGTGLQNAVNALDHAPQGFNAPIHLGTDPLGNRIYEGLMDEVAFFDHALSPAEIQAIHDAAYNNTYTPVPPSVAVQPASQTVFIGDDCAFTATAAGSQPLSYQWTKDSLNIAGAIRGSLNLTSVSASDSGTYRWIVTQGSTTVTSTPAILTVLPIPTTANLTNQLVLHLRFDGNLTDTSGLHHDGTAGGTPAFVPGKIGSEAVALNTVSSSSTFNYVSLGSLPDFAFGETDSFSVSFWAKYTSWKNDLPMIGNAVGSTYQLGWVFADENGKIEFSLVSEANSGTYVADPVGGSPVINDGVWHNVVGVVDRGSLTASVFVDGSLAGSFSIAGLGTLDQSTALTVGQNPDGNYGVDGSAGFDDVGIWRKALSATEARSIYYAGQNGNSFDTVAPPSVTLSIQLSGNSLTLQWPSGTLESSDQAGGGYAPVSGANPPSYTTTIGTSGSRFYRVKVQ